MPDSARINAFKALSREEERIRKRQKRHAFWLAVALLLAVATMASGLMLFLLEVKKR